jgi:phosphoribosyl-ATP pyrophosphohydrolase/phosphoribosyl-AMP cyclohydrolase
MTSHRIKTVGDLDALDFDRAGGTVTVVVQDNANDNVLMVAHADRDALERTLATGEMHFLSRTRGPWHKGATSGNVQRVVSLDHDCDGDAVLARVRPAGPACHTGEYSCFGSGEFEGMYCGPSDEPPDALMTFRMVDAIVASRARTPGAAGSYTRRLLDDRNLRLKKLGEEAIELAVACADEDRERAVGEAADVVFHTLVALRSLGAGLDDVAAELARRQSRGSGASVRGTSGAG